MKLLDFLNVAEVAQALLKRHQFEKTESFYHHHLLDDIDNAVDDMGYSISEEECKTVFEVLIEIGVLIPRPCPGYITTYKLNYDADLES